MFFKVTAFLALAASASAHMTLEYPTPFANTTLSRAPLEPADFPCKQRAGVYDIVEMNQWNAGETQTVSFLGTAVHGGGSCQFSITTDSEPTESSQWKVIHSVVGGCPSNVTGNLEDDENKIHGAATFPVTMPESIPDGRYTFAWTWLNKVGNREFYMNCAPIQVGSSGATASSANAAAALSALPDMFVVNLPSTSCSTKEDEDFNYPDPGSSLVDGNSANLGDTLDGTGCASMTKLGAGSGQIGSPTGAPASSAPAATQPAASSPATSSAPGYPAASAPVASAPAASSASGYPAAPVPSASLVASVPGLFAPGASSAPAATSAAPVASATPIASAAPVASAAPSTPSTGKDCTPCTNDGAVVCMGTNSFGLCNRGCAVAQQLAAGMACIDGAITAAVSKRSFPRAHLHRRHGSGLRLL